MDLKKNLQNAIEFHKKGNFYEAKNAYEKILKSNPDLPEINFNLGILLKSMDLLNESERRFTKAISIKPDFVHAHYHLGNTKYKLKKFEESEYSYKKTISFNSKFVEAYINLSRAQRELGKLSEAEESARIALKLKPDLADTNNQLSLILFDRGRLSDDLQNKSLDKLNEAKKIILKAIYLKPDYALSHLNYGLILQELGDLNVAKDALQKSLKLDPNSFLAKYNLDILLKQINLLNEMGINLNSKGILNSNFKKKFSKNPFITHRNPNKELVNLLYKINSTELNKTKGGPLFGNGKTSDYQIFDNDNSILNEVKKDIIRIIKEEIKSNVFIIDSFFNILGAGGGSVPHHHLNSFDKTFNLDNQKYSLTYYLDVGDQNCKEPGYFKMNDPEEKVLPSNGMIMIIPASRKHSAVYEGKSDRLMIGINFYCY
jgi:tetratricopeptide (TPR) repeat protein